MNENEYSFSDYIKPIITGTLISLLSIGILMFIISIVMTKVDFPLGFVTPIAVAIIFISTFIGSFISSKNFGKKGLFVGLSTSLAVFMIILLVNLSIEPQGFGSIAIVKAVATVLAGIIGGVTGVNSRHSSKVKI